MTVPDKLPALEEKKGARPPVLRGVNVGNLEASGLQEGDLRGPEIPTEL